MAVHPYATLLNGILSYRGRLTCINTIALIMMFFKCELFQKSKLLHFECVNSVKYMYAID